ncbi:hypothetical protein OSB04_015359 [Centaurea solstitialis]|uniref:Ubiquitin-like domain-containing protein n=1 Tax=Centaurea solstitialis TaxID=347529 RepID=A0AA38WIN5_9ASTR|nr:hypothetical protein OSB04_015359 [Centaurea solstitialis]
MSGVNNDEDKKPGTGGDQGAHINLKVKGQDGNEVFFRIKRSTQLKKLMNAYCDRQSVELNSIAFLFDGRRLRGEQTPDEGPFLSRLMGFAAYSVSYTELFGNGLGAVLRMLTRVSTYQVTLLYRLHMCMARTNSLTRQEQRQGRKSYLLEMEEGDEIDAMLHQTGGFGNF